MARDATPVSTANRQQAGSAGGENKDGGAKKERVEQLSFSAQIRDGATYVFLFIHLLAFLTPFLYGLAWRDAGLVFITYNLRMFGA